jgi:ankyrin repeat protein
MTKIKLTKFLVSILLFLQCCTFSSFSEETTSKVESQEIKVTNEFQAPQSPSGQKQNNKEENERSELDKKLFQAIKQGEVELVQELLLKGASAKAKLNIEETIHTPLTYALSCEMIDICGETDEIDRIKSIVKLLIEFGADVNSKIQPFGDSPLRLASVRAEVGFEEIVEMLIKAGADVNEKKDGRTVLFGALNPETIKILLRNGLSPNHRDKEGRTALHYLLEMMPKEISDNEDLETQYAEAVKALAQGGANVNLKIKTDPLSLPLCIAQFKYAEKVVEVLRELGAKGDCE